MSLRIYLKKEDIPSDETLITDVEDEYYKHTLPINEYTKKLFKTVDQITLNDDGTLVDRFGYKVKEDAICNGSKAAVCVLMSDDIIALTESGYNARDFIIKNLNKGKILLLNRAITIEGYAELIDAIIGNYRFNTVWRLNYYLTEEYEICEPDLSLEGISHV